MARRREWTKERVTAAMRGWRAESGRWPTWRDWTPSVAAQASRARWQAGRYPHASAARGAFGTWGAALGAVSREPAKRPYTHFDEPRVATWTREAIVDAIHRWAAGRGEPPAYQEWSPAMARRRGREDVAEAFYEGEWPPAAVVARRFGSWAEAIEASGFAARAPGWESARERGGGARR